MPRSRIAALNVYPVKSCAGFSRDRVRVAARGLVATTPSGSAGDREWMIVDRDGRFVSQREYPRLALIARASRAACSSSRAGPAAARGVRRAAGRRDARGRGLEQPRSRPRRRRRRRRVAVRGPRRRRSSRPLRSGASAPSQSGLRRRLGRAHGVRRRVSAARHRGILAHRTQRAARGRRLTRAADEPIPPEHRARGPRSVRRGPHRHRSAPTASP